MRIKPIPKYTEKYCNYLGSAEELRIIIFRCSAPYSTSSMNVISTKIARLCRLRCRAPKYL